MNLVQAEQILKKKIKHITRDYNEEDQALDFLLDLIDTQSKKIKELTSGGVMNLNESYHDYMDHLKDLADAYNEDNE